jgi:protein-disulfide isomerase
MGYAYLLRIGILICTLYITGVCSSYRDSLSEDQMSVFKSAQKGIRIPQCSNKTLESLSENFSKCKIGSRLSSFAAWLAHLDKDSAFITSKLEKRYVSFTSDKRYEIDENFFEIAGDKEAPVNIAVYISISCPYCKKISALLYDSVTVGSLKGKARLCVKLLSVTDRDMALLAAHGCGKFWEYMKKLSTIKQRLDMDVLLKAAEDISMPMKAFKAYMENPAVHAYAHESRQEGLSNGVKSTPTFFINGREYLSYQNPIWIVDAVEYEYERVRNNY